MNANLKIKRVVLIGGNGFVGSHLWSHLSSNFNASLTIISRKFSSENLQLARTRNVQLVVADYRDLLSLTPVITGADLVYHLASSSFPSSSWDNPVPDIEQNLIPSVTLFDHCCKLGVKKVAFISSGGSVYGKSEVRLMENDLQKPFSPHGIIKLSIEHFLEYYRIKHGLNYDIYRLSNTYGPGQNKLGFGVINTWLRNIVEGEKILIYGDGEAEKDFIYIDDAIKMISYSMRADLNKSEIFNVNSGVESTLNDIVDIVKNLDSKVKVEHKQDIPSDNKVVRLSNKKILGKFKEFEFTPLSAGIARTWAFMTTD